jgi:hypothetical protein
MRRRRPSVRFSIGLRKRLVIWSNQIELYFSIVQRKALTPNDFPNLQALTDRLTTFAEHYRTIARPFDWTFTRNDLNQVLVKIADREPDLRLAAQRSKPPDSSTSQPTSRADHRRLRAEPRRDWARR